MRVTSAPKKILSFTDGFFPKYQRKNRYQLAPLYSPLFPVHRDFIEATRTTSPNRIKTG